MTEEEEENKIYPQRPRVSQHPYKDEIAQIQDRKTVVIPILKIRSASSRTRFRLNLSPTNISETVLAIEFRGLIPNEQKLVGHLFWHCLFGKNFKSAHWYFLFNMFEKHQEENDSIVNALFYGCLIESTPRKRVNSFDVNHIPLRKQFKGVFVPDKFRTVFQDRPLGLIDLIVHHFNIPKKALPLESLVYWYKYTFKQKKPIEPVRIGVGYKDKGSLGSGDGYEPDIPVWNPTLFDDSWFVALTWWKQLSVNLRR